MPLQDLALVIWIALMILTWFYVQRHKRADVKPVAAYMIFMVVLSTVAIVLFVGLSYLADLAGLKPFVDQPVGAALLLLAVFVPAFLAAHYQLHFKPMKSPDVE